MVFVSVAVDLEVAVVFVSVAVDLEVAVVFVSVAVDLEVAKAAVLLVVLTVVVEVLLLVLVDVVVTVLLLGDEILGCTAGCTDLPDARAFFAISDGDTFFFTNCDTATAVFGEAVFSLSFFFICTASMPCLNCSI